MKKDFQVIPVDDQIAQISAELRHKYNLSMGDSIMAATASELKQYAFQTTHTLDKSKKSTQHGYNHAFRVIGIKFPLRDF